MSRTLVLASLAAAFALATTASSPANADTPATGEATGPTFDPDAIYKVSVGDAPMVGPRTAPITVVAWSDYACGYCNRVQDTLDRLGRLYPGQIRWVHRTLPLDDDNTIAAEGALAAAAQGKFLAMHQRLFALRGRVDRTTVELIGRELGLDMLRLRGDLDAGTYRASIARDIADARALGVSGTPMFFVNGRAIHGSQPLRVFTAVVDDELARASHELAANHPLDLYAALTANGHARADATPDRERKAVQLDPKQIYRIGVGLPHHQQGPDTALVTIVEWSDFQCPYCAQQAPVLAELRKKYGDDLRIIYRHFPVRFHKDSMIAAEAGVAAAEQGKFWPFHDAVFANFGKLSRADLESFAKAAGLDLARFRAALDDRRYHDAIIAEGADAEALGVDGTPTMFVNGQPLIGARDRNNLEHVVDAHMTRAREAIAHGVPATDVYALVMSSAQGDERADPSRVPVPAAVRIELRPEERGRAITAACRRGDAQRAGELAHGFSGDAKARALAVCAGEGVDLP